ncbi:MAG: baeRF3 domain-containing protein, partial [Burkholderiales bacterium]
MSANLNANVHATGKHKDIPLFHRLKPLLADYPPPCLSLYQRTFRAFPDSQQNPVHYRNLLKELSTALERNRVGAASEKLLQPFERLLDDAEFWAHPQDGLAVFGAAGFFHVEKIQRPVPELVVVNEHLYIKPLIRVFQSEDAYQILALDRKEIKLYQGNRYVVDQIPLAPSVPKTIDEALGPEVELPGVDRVAPFAAGRGGQAVYAYHGHGSKMDEARLDIERFFRAVDRAIAEAHSKPSAIPLILAALPEYHSRFRALSHNPLLLDEGIHLNADAHTRDELRDAAWRVMEPRYHARLQQLIDAYHAAKARALATDDLTHALEFATDGRVGTLLVEA